MKTPIVLMMLIGIIGCATNESQLRETLNKNPKIVFDLIEDHPEQFIEVINRAAQKAQQMQYEKQISQIKEDQERDLQKPKKPQLSDDRRLLGNANSEIVIVEYADLQCPACRVGFQSLNQFKEKYKNKIQFYFKHMPLDFHKMAYPAAQYFEAIKIQDKTKAFKFLDYVFQNQRQLTDEAFLKKAATAVSANMSKLANDLKSDKIGMTIEEDMNEFKNFGFTGTPVVLINGVALQGAQKLEELERVLRLTQK